MEKEAFDILSATVLKEHRKIKWFKLSLFFRKKSAVMALAILIAGIIMAVLGSAIAPYPDQGLGEVNISERLCPPSAAYWFGTDTYGRDILSRVICGARVSIFGGFFIVICAAFIGVPLGLWAGYNEGFSGGLILRIVELFLSFPSTLIAMGISLVVGAGSITALVALIIPWWPWYTRLVMGEVFSIKRMLYVEAAQMLGYGKFYILWKHILPNILTPVIVVILLDLGPAIIAIGLLSFLGLGTQSPNADWGLMVWEGASNILDQWWIAIVPGAAMFIMVIAFNLFGDALKEILEPDRP